jgi:F-type H+-transporting ATPase subunit b
MDILGKFGFEWGLFLAQIVNFLILAYLFQRFLYKPLLKTLKDRREKIAEGLSDAEKATLAKEAAESEKSKIIKAAAAEAQKIIDDTKKQGEVIREEILSKAREDADKIMATAKEQSNLEMERMRKEAGNMSLTLSKSILENVIKGLFDKNEQSELVKKGLKEIEKNG